MTSNNQTVHEIRRSPSDIWFATGLAALVSVCLLSGLTVSEGQDSLMPRFTGVAIGAFAILLNRTMSADVVRLTPSHIEKVSLFGRKSLLLTDVTGGISGEQVVLATHGGKPGMALPSYVKRSPEILKWVQSLDNLTDV
jgi:hypothetical protein